MFKLLLEAITNPTPKQRVTILMLCCASVVGGMGCATMFAAHRSEQRKRTVRRTPIHTDTIIAMGRPDVTLAKRVGKEAIAFVGKKKTYLLIKGGDRIADIAKELDGNKLTVEKQQNSLYIRKKVIWGTLRLGYRGSRGESLDPSTETALKALGFQSNHRKEYYLDIAVEGTVHPPLNIPPEQLASLAQVRDISFYRSPDASPPPDLQALVEIPLGIATDVALTPVYFGLFIVIIVAAN